jgi:hypothetical protein
MQIVAGEVRSVENVKKCNISVLIRRFNILKEGNGSRSDIDTNTCSMRGLVGVTQHYWTMGGAHTS